MAEPKELPHRLKFRAETFVEALLEPRWPCSASTRSSSIAFVTDIRSLEPSGNELFDVEENAMNRVSLSVLSGQPRPPRFSQQNRGGQAPPYESV